MFSQPFLFHLDVVPNVQFSESFFLLYLKYPFSRSLVSQSFLFVVAPLQHSLLFYLISVAPIKKKNLTKSYFRKRKEFIWLIPLGHSSFPRKINTKTQGKNPEAGIREQSCLLVFFQSFSMAHSYFSSFFPLFF